MAASHARKPTPQPAAARPPQSERASAVVGEEGAPTVGQTIAEAGSAPRPYAPPDRPGAHALRQQNLLNLQRQLGNGAARRLIQRNEQDDQATTAARGVYDALDGWNNEARALGHIRGKDAATRQRMDEEFRRLYNRSIRAYLKDQLGGDDLVNGYALMYSGTDAEQHTAVARSLIPTGTRDVELFRVLESLPHSGRQRLEQEYNRAFGAAGQGSLKIGEGSLTADLKDDLSGWALDKSLALIDRDLKPADHLYFESVAITGTHDDAVVRYIQEAWDAGPANFANFERDWDRYIKGTEGWSAERRPNTPWTNMTLRQALRDELSGEAWDLVNAVLTGYERYKQAGGVQQGADGSFTAASSAGQTEAQIAALEDIQIQIAEDTLTAATTGGFTGAGTNEDQVFRAVRQLRQIWQGRIDRARGKNDAQLLADYERRWNERRQRLIAFLPNEMDEGTAENRQARLLLLGDLSDADKLYIAARVDYDFDKAVQIVDQAWQQGRMAALLRDAASPRSDAGTELRPRFEPFLAIGANHGMPARRIITLTRSDLDDTGRGALRLALEIDDGDNDSNLQKAYALLKDAPVGLRTAVVERFVSEHGLRGDEPSRRRFLAYLSRRYENSYHYYEFLNLLDPAADAAERARRAREQAATQQTGWYNPVTWGVGLYDLVTAEDSRQVVAESTQRLDYIAQANENELRVMMAMTGATDRSQLAQMEQTQFQSRLAELRSLNRSITEGIATAVEIAVELALTALTGGGAAPALLASLGAALAGMLAREAMLGQDYDLISEQNLQQLVLTVATAGFGQAARPLEEAAEHIGQIARLGESGQRFLQAAVREGFTQVNTTILRSGFQNRMPTGEEIAASAVNILGRSIGAGRAAQIMGERGENLRSRLLANLSGELIGGLTEETTSIAATGLGNMTALDVAGRYGARVATSVRDGVKGAARDELGARADARRAGDDQQSTESGLVRGADGNPAIPSIANQIHQPVGRPLTGTEEQAHAMLRRIANGDAAALREIGIPDVPQGYDPRAREWGLGRRSDGSFVIIQGDSGAVTWSGLIRNGITPIGHSHPFSSQMALPGGAVRVGEILGNQRLVERILPSGADITTLGRNGVDYHELHTPFVDAGNGAIANPTPGVAGNGVTIVIANVRLAGYDYGNPVYSAHIVIQNERNEALGTMQLWGEHMVGAGGLSILHTSQPSGLTPQPRRFGS